MDVYCRICGEPWDCTGGLHISHLGMEWWQAEAFFQGRGCPCCEGHRGPGEALASEDLNARWQSSLMAATDEVEPWSGFLQDPFQHVRSGWPRGEPTLTELVTREDVALLGDLDDRIVEDRLEEPDPKTRLPITELWVPLSEAWYNLSDDADLVLVSNAHVMKRDLDQEGLEWRERAFAIQVLVGRIVGSAVTIDPKAVKWIEETERALEKYPLLDDQDFGQREHDAMLESIEEGGRYLVKDEVPLDWPGQVLTWLQRNGSEFGSDEGRPYVKEADLRDALKELALLEQEDPA